MRLDLYQAETARIAAGQSANFLKLDFSKAKARLGWQPRWALQKALHASVEWHQQWLAGVNMKAFTMAQIDQYR